MGERLAGEPHDTGEDRMSARFKAEKLPPLPAGQDLVILPGSQPWLIDVWERLKTKAPCPDKTLPYCCYARTVIFYLRPYTVLPWHHFWVSRGRRRAEKPGQRYEAWDQVEHEVTW